MESVNPHPTDYSAELWIVAILAIFVLLVRFIYKMVSGIKSESKRFIDSKRHITDVFKKIQNKTRLFSELEREEFRYLRDSRVVDKSVQGGLNIAELIKIRDSAVKLNRKSNMPEKFKINKALQAEFDELNKEARHYFYDFIELNICFLGYEINEGDYTEKIKQLTEGIEKIFDDFLKLEIRYCILVKSIKKGKINLVNTQYQIIKKRLDEFKSFLEHYTLSIIK